MIPCRPGPAGPRELPDQRRARPVVGRAPIDGGVEAHMRPVLPARAWLPATIALSLAAALATAAPVAAQAEPVETAGPSPQAPSRPDRLTVVATYPVVMADPGGEARFSLRVTSPRDERVDLVVEGLPAGFEGTFRGGNATVGSVFTDAEEPPALELRVNVPDAAVAGTHGAVVVAASATERVELPVDVVVADLSGGVVSLETEFRALRGDADNTFTFNLDLRNDTAQDIDFTVAIEGPAGWDVHVRPVGTELAATTPVSAGSTEDLRASITPPRRADAGVYPIVVRASGGGHDAELELSVEITGSYAMTLTTPDGRLNTTAQAGTAARFDLLVVNEGTAPLVDVSFDARTPTGWEVTFEPEVVELVAAGGTATAAAVITPAGESVAGDYVVTIMVDTDEADDQIEVRATVETSTLWGAVALAIIALVLIGLALVFRRYGRR
jgi:uncharacterized membrane protein